MPNAHTRTGNVELTEVERAELVSMARSRSLPAALALRARIVLACEGADTLGFFALTPTVCDAAWADDLRSFTQGRTAELHIAGFTSSLPTPSNACSTSTRFTTPP